MITAHSGCDHTEDNSLAFMTYALSLDADAFEVDIRKNNEGMLVLSHDAAQLDAIALSEAFRLLSKHPDKKMNCDLKQKHIEADVYDLACRFGVENQLIFTGDVNPELFRKNAVVYPKIAWYANLEVLDPEFEVWKKNASELEIVQRLEQILFKMKDYEAEGLNWYYALAERVWEKARTLGIGISVWTVNDTEEQKKWLERNAENITSRAISALIVLRDHQK